MKSCFQELWASLHRSQRSAMLVGVALACLTSTVSAAIVLDGGPVSAPPGAGFETFSGAAGVSGGAIIDYTSIELSQTANLYFGVRNDAFVNGFSMDGSSITGAEVFRLSAFGPNSITCTGLTTLMSWTWAF